jgi:hypothetical protein
MERRRASSQSVVLIPVSPQTATNDEQAGGAMALRYQRASGTAQEVAPNPPSTILWMLFDHCPIVPGRHIRQAVTAPHPNTDAGGCAEHIHLLISCRCSRGLARIVRGANFHISTLAKARRRTGTAFHALIHVNATANR